MTQPKISRRECSFAFLSLLTFLIVSACGHSQQETDPKTTPATAKRTVQHPFGETQIPITPERIVLLIPGGVLDNLLALGVKPIGMGVFKNRDYQIPPYLADQAIGIESVGNFVQPNLETILQLQPDLIIISNFQKRLYPKLSQIAPTVAVSLAAQTWKNNFLSLAKFVNRVNVAEKLIVQYEERINELKTAMNREKKNPKVSVLRVRFDGIFLYVKSSLIGQILEEANIERPASQDVFLEDSPRIAISLEELEKADGDVMFVYGLEFKGTEEAFAKLQSHPLWQKLNVVQNDRVYVVPDTYWSFPGIQGIDLLLDDLFKYVIQKPS